MQYNPADDEIALRIKMIRAKLELIELALKNKSYYNSNILNTLGIPKNHHVSAMLYTVKKAELEAEIEALEARDFDSFVFDNGEFFFTE